MAFPGLVYKDLLPVPHDADALTDPSKKEVAHALAEGATASHVLATATPPAEEQGQAQMDHDAEVKNLGWNEPKHNIAAPLVGGMENEDLWVLIRRFNKVSGLEEVRIDLSNWVLTGSSKCTMSRSSPIQSPTT